MKKLLLLIFLISGEIMAFSFSSPDFGDNQTIPTKFTCEGENISPALEWKNPPAGTKSFVLIVDDPDAPDPRAPKMTYVHWVAYDIPASVSSFPQNIPPVERLDNGAISGFSDSKKFGYNGPCPPIGEHRYFFKLYALKTTLNLSPGKTKNDVVQAMNGKILGEVKFIGKYSKKNN
jgi:Raf kinase inhibitor-like YbhB/YbcL family protein